MKRAVVDQPGFKILFFGVFVAIVIGFLIKIQIAPKKIRTIFNDAILRLEPDVKIDFKTAEIKLSDWGWPQPYLEVHDIRVSPVKAVCDESQIFIETLSFPITWNLLFESKKVIQSLRMTQLEIRLSEFKNCFSLSQTDPNLQSQSVLNQALLQLFSAPTAEQLRELKVDRVKILSKSNYEMPILLQAAVFDFSYTNQKLSKITLNSQLFSDRDHKKQVYNLKSDLSLVISKKSDLQISILGHVSGRWIDQVSNFDFNYDDQANEIIFTAQVQKFALKQLFQFLDTEKKSILNKIKNDLLGYYVSTDFIGRYSLTENILKNLEFKNLSMDSESAQIKSEDIQFTGLNPIQMRPAKVSVKNLELKNFFLNKVKNSAGKTKSSKNAKITGELIVSADQSFKFSGHMNDASYVYEFDQVSAVENMDSAEIEMNGHLQEEYLNAQIQKIILNEQPVLGIIKYSADHQKPDEYSLDIRGEILSPQSLKKILGSEQKVIWSLKMKQDGLGIFKELKAEKLSYFDLELNDFNFTARSLMSDKTETVQLQVQKINWPDTLANSSNELADFYLKQIHQNSILLEGTYHPETGQYILFNKLDKNLKNKKIEIQLLNRKYEILNL